MCLQRKVCTLSIANKRTSIEPKALDKKVYHQQNMSNKKHPIMTTDDAT
mgnify:FL=1